MVYSGNRFMRWQYQKQNSVISALAILFAASALSLSGCGTQAPTQKAYIEDPDPIKHPALLPPVPMTADYKAPAPLKHSGKSHVKNVPKIPTALKTSKQPEKPPDPIKSTTMQKKSDLPEPSTTPPEAAYKSLLDKMQPKKEKEATQLGKNKSNAPVQTPVAPTTKSTPSNKQTSKKTTSNTSATESAPNIKTDLPEPPNPAAKKTTAPKAPAAPKAPQAPQATRSSPTSKPSGIRVPQ
ncbi:MAG: hypothetical protein KTR14_04770 [Vampirovibrio sp.]|nr:hypothetical protein [Vampirovibrio sp.]